MAQLPEQRRSQLGGAPSSNSGSRPGTVSWRTVREGRSTHSNRFLQPIHLTLKASFLYQLFLRSLHPADRFFLSTSLQQRRPRSYCHLSSTVARNTGKMYKLVWLTEPALLPLARRWSSSSPLLILQRSSMPATCVAPSSGLSSPTYTQPWDGMLLR